MHLDPSSGSYACIMFLLVCQLLKLMSSSSFCSLKEIGAQKYLLLVSSFYGPRIIVIAKLILSDLHLMSKNWSIAICKTILQSGSIYIYKRCIYLYVFFWLHWVFFAANGLFWLQWVWGLLFVAVFSLLIAVTSLVSKHMLGCCESEFVALPHVGSSWTRDGTLHWQVGSLPLDHRGGPQDRSIFECFTQKMRILHGFLQL